MTNLYQLRRRAKNREDAEIEVPPLDSSRSRRRGFLKGAKPLLKALMRYVAAGAAGMLCAAATTQVAAVAFVFFASGFALIASLVLVLMSILKDPDNTPISIPAIHNPDGTVVAQPDITVHEHDKQIAQYFCSEFVALSIAAIWFYLWTLFKPACLCLAAYLAYRIFYHPLFRIHLWKEPDCPEFYRPFGGVPLFKKDATSAVKVVEGKSEFDAALSSVSRSSLVVCDFSAKWCPPCRAIAPVFAKLAEEFTESTFLSIDVDISRDVAKEQEISSVPTFIFYRDGQRLESLRGASPQKLRQTIETYM